MTKKFYILVFFATLFITAKSQTTSLPYYNNFDSAAYNSIVCTSSTGTKTLMDGWASEDANNDGQTWFISNRNYSMYVPYSIPNSLTTSWSGSTVNDHMFTPAFSFTAGQNYTLKFYRQLSSDMSATTFTVGMYSSQSSSSLSGDLLYNETIHHGWVEVEIIFSPATSGNYHIGFHAQSTGFTGIVAIDDLSLLPQNPSQNIVSLFPAANSISANINTEISVEFDHPVNIENPSSITISNATGISASVDASNPNKLLIAHDNFSYDTQYTVDIPPTAVADFTGTTWTFTTVDSIVLLNSVFPQNNETGIFPNQRVIMEFNQQPTILNQSLITFTNGVVVTSASIDGNKLYLEHTPYQRGETYTLTIAQGAIYRYAGTSVTFHIVADGDIPNITHLYGPVNYIQNIRNVSENGRYCVGKANVYGAFMWDVLLDGYYPISSSSYNSESYGVSNFGHVAMYAQESMTALSLPCLWFESEKTVLPFTNSGSALCITSDGTQIGGQTQGETPLGSFGSIACVWKLNENNIWNCVEYATLPDHITNQTRIEMLSSNGSIAVGRTNIENYTQTVFEACYWKSPDTITLMNISQEFQTDMTCISGNGRWAGILRGGGIAPLIYDFTTETSIELPCGSGPINSITDDGFVITVEGSASIGWNTYVYNINTGECKLFSQWVIQDLPNIYVMDDETLAALNSQVAITGSNCRVMSVSPDGKNWAIQNNAQAFMLHLQRLDEVGILETNEIDTKVIPTLTKDIINITTQGNATVSVVDLLGRRLQSKLINNYTTLNLSNLTNGIYIIVVETSQGKSTHKVVLQK